MQSAEPAPKNGQGSGVMSHSTGDKVLLPFEKMQAVGNDFVVISTDEWPEQDWQRLAVDVCNRHFGVGSDGLLVVSRTEGTGFRMRMFNPDGTEDGCGNGLRCAARFAWIHLDSSARCMAATMAGLQPTEILWHGDVKSMVRVGMGQPQLSPSSVPVQSDLDPVVDLAVSVGNHERLLTCVNTGSTHAVIFLNRPVDQDVFQTESPVLETHALFPQRTTILWAWPEGAGRFHVRIWERGAGETMGCGTGACAVAVAARLHGMTEGPVDVVSSGGSLQIEQDSSGSIWMTGPAASVFRGMWAIPSLPAQAGNQEAAAPAGL